MNNEGGKRKSEEKGGRRDREERAFAGDLTADQKCKLKKNGKKKISQEPMVLTREREWANL